LRKRMTKNGFMSKQCFLWRSLHKSSRSWTITSKTFKIKGDMQTRIKKTVSQVLNEFALSS